MCLPASKANDLSEVCSLHIFFDAEMNSEVSTRPMSRPQRGAQNCQRQKASCKHAESGPIHITVIDKTPECTSAERGYPAGCRHECVSRLRRQMTFRRFVLRTNAALEFTRRSNRDLVRSTNSQSATKPFLAGMSQILVDTHDCQPHRIGYFFGNFCLFNMRFLMELVIGFMPAPVRSISTSSAG